MNSGLVLLGVGLSSEGYMEEKECEDEKEGIIRSAAGGEVVSKSVGMVDGGLGLVGTGIPSGA